MPKGDKVQEYTDQGVPVPPGWTKEQFERFAAWSYDQICRYGTVRLEVKDGPPPDHGQARLAWWC